MIAALCVAYVASLALAGWVLWLRHERAYKALLEAEVASLRQADAGLLLSLEAIGKDVAKHGRSIEQIEDRLDRRAR